MNQNSKTPDVFERSFEAFLLLLSLYWPSPPREAPQTFGWFHSCPLARGLAVARAFASCFQEMKRFTYFVTS